LLLLSHGVKIFRTTFGKKVEFYFSYFVIDFSPFFKKKSLEVKKKHTDFFLHIYVVRDASPWFLKVLNNPGSFPKCTEYPEMHIFRNAGIPHQNYTYVYGLVFFGRLLYFSIIYAL